MERKSEPTMVRTFSELVCPEVTSTMDGLMLSDLAMSVQIDLLAFPFSGAAAMRTLRRSPSMPAIWFLDAPGTALIGSVIEVGGAFMMGGSVAVSGDRVVEAFDEEEDVRIGEEAVLVDISGEVFGVEGAEEGADIEVVELGVLGVVHRVVGIDGHELVGGDIAHHG